MPRRLKVTSPEGLTVTLDWEEEEDPSDDDLDEIFAEAGKSAPPKVKEPSKPAVPYTSFAGMAPAPAQFDSPLKVIGKGVKTEDDGLALPIRDAAESTRTAEPVLSEDTSEIGSFEELGKINREYQTAKATKAGRAKDEAKRKAIEAGKKVSRETGVYPGTFIPTSISSTPEAIAEKDVGRKRPGGKFNTVVDAYKGMTYPLQVIRGALEGKSPTERLGERYLATKEALENAEEMERIQNKKKKGEKLSKEEEIKLAVAPKFWETVGTVVRGVIDNPTEFAKVIGLDIVENLPLYMGAQGVAGAVGRLGERAYAAQKFAVKARGLARFEKSGLKQAAKLELPADQIRKSDQIKRHLDRLKTALERNEGKGVRAAEKALVAPSKAKVIGSEIAENVAADVGVGIPLEHQKGNEYGLGAGVQDVGIGLLLSLPGMAKLKAGKGITAGEFKEIARVVNRNNLHEHPAIHEIMPVLKDLSKNPEYKGYFEQITKERKTISREAAAKNYGKEYIEKSFPDTPEFEAAGQAAGDGLKPGQARLYNRARASDAVEEAAHIAEGSLKEGALKDALTEWKSETRAKAKEQGIDLPNDNELFVQAFSAKAGKDSDYPEAIRNLDIPQDLYDEFNRGLGIGGVKEPNARFANEKIAEQVVPAETRPPLEVPPETPQAEIKPEEFGFTKAALDKEIFERARDYGVDPTHQRVLADSKNSVMDKMETGLLNEETYIKDRENPEIGKSHIAYDLGNFKEFNDKYGHVEGGDVVLKSFGQILGKLTDKHGGRSYRPHGDEFNGVHPDEASALQIAKKAQEIAAKTKIEFFDNAGNKTGEVDGFIVDYAHGADYKSADAELKRAKAEAKKSRPVYRERAPERRGPGDVPRTDEGTGRGPDEGYTPGHDAVVGGSGQTATGVVTEPPPTLPSFSKFRQAAVYLRAISRKEITNQDISRFVLNLGKDPVPKIPPRKSPGSIADRALVSQGIEETKRLLERGDESIETVQVRAQDLPDKFKIAGVELTKVKVRDPFNIRYKDSAGHKFDFKKDQMVHTGGEVKLDEPSGPPIGDLPGDEEIPFSLKPSQKKETHPAIDKEVEVKVRGFLDTKSSMEEILTEESIRAEFDKLSGKTYTNTLPGYGTPEFQSERVFNFDGEEVKGYDAGVERLVEKAKSYAKGEVKNNRQATLVLGAPAAGKSKFSEKIAEDTGAAIIDSDDAKKVLPEYDSGRGTSAVHEESSDITFEIDDSVFDKLVGEGANVVIPRLGKTASKMLDMAKILKSLGYTIDVVHVKVEKNEAFRRNMKRFVDSGRLVHYKSYEGLDNINETVYALNREGLTNEPIEIDNNGPRQEPTKDGDGSLRPIGGRRSDVGSPPAQIPGSVRQREEVSPERQSDLFGGRGRVASQGLIKGKGVDKGLEGLPLQEGADRAEVDKVQTSLFSLKPKKNETDSELFKGHPSEQLKNIKTNPLTFSNGELSKISSYMKRAGYDWRGSDDARNILIKMSNASGFDGFTGDHAKAIQYALKEKTPVEKVLSKAARYFGTTGDFREAGYLLPNGAMLDFSGKRFGGSAGTRAMDHRQIGEAIDDNPGGTEGMREFMGQGAIRMMEMNNGLDIDVLPTSAQEAVLRKYFAKADRKKYEFIPVDVKNGQKGEWAREYPVGTSPDRILKDIRDVFAGKKPSEISGVQKFRTSEDNPLFSLKPASEAGVPDKAGQNKKEIARARAAWEKQGTDSPYFKRWFGDSKVVDKKGNPVVVYHGTQRPDRVGARFQKSRATSGPSAYFTDDPEIASNYAKGKRDTSIEDIHYSHWFKVPFGRSKVNVDQAWWRISPEERAVIAENAPKLGFDEYPNDQKIILKEGNTRGTGGYEQNLKEARGNHLKALVEEWLTSGNLFNSEEDFSQVLRMAGLKNFEEDFPHVAYPGVYPTYLAIKNPLVSNKIPKSVVSELENSAKFQRSPKREIGTDAWDKELRDPQSWLQQLKDDYAKGENSYVWTSIPDWVVNALKRLGYDGIQDTGGKMGGKGHNVWVPFEPEQIKSATGNRGTFDPESPNIAYSLKPVTPPQRRANEREKIFYSHLNRTIDSKMPNAATPNDIRGIMKGAGVKEEEIKWTGLDDFLAGKEKVTKAELLKHLEENAVEVQEVTRGDIKPENPRIKELQALIQENKKRILSNSEEGRKAALSVADGSHDLRIKIKKERDELFDKNSDLVDELHDAKNADEFEYKPTKFSQYQTPGGENYRELLLTLPNSKADKLQSRRREIEALGKGATAAQKDEWASIMNRLKPDDRDVEGVDRLKGFPQFKSTHFTEPNILAHVRFNERKTADGHKVLFLEEVQSDWHQAGRKDGYKAPDDEIKSQIQVLDKRRVEIEDEATKRNKVGQKDSPELISEWTEIKEKIDKLNRQHAVGVPNAPFKKTWHELALRRMLRYASENGFDRLAWTTGDMQAQRYPNELRKVADNISWNTDESGIKEFFIRKDGSLVMSGLIDNETGMIRDATISEAEGKRPEEVFGKGMAEKVSAEDGGEIKGEDFTIGAHGMQAFYDKMIPQYLDKYGKKWGAKTEEIDLGGEKSKKLSFEEQREKTSQYLYNKPYAELDPSDKNSVDFELEGRQRHDIGTKSDGGPGLVQSIPITEAMRQSVMTEGQPLFSLKKPMVERKVEALRKSESGYGQAYSNLVRDKEETWASLEDDARKIAENWDWEDFTKTTKGRQLNASEVMAIGARIADADLREVDALTESAAARAAGDKKGANIADAKAAAVQLEKVALLQAGLNNATQSARALNVHRKWMDAIAKNSDSVFLLKAIRELGVTDLEALKLLRIFKDDPKNFGAAIHSYLKFGAVDKIMEYWKAGLLSGAPTHVANTAGNTIEAGLMNAETFVSAGMDKILGLFQNNGERQRYMGEGLRETVGLARGFIPAAKKFMEGLAPIAKLESKTVNLENKFERQVGAIKGKKGELIRTPFKFLELEDDYFKTLGKYADIQKLAYRKARKEGLSGDKLKSREGEIVAEFWNSPDKHRDIAQEVSKSGKIRTYQEASIDKPYKNSFAALADEIAKAKNSQAPAVRLVSNIIFPFSKTPANIFDRAIERSPIGYAHSIKVLSDWGKAAKVYETKARIAEQNSGNIGYQQAAKSARNEMNRLRGAASDQLARATVGTVALTGIGLLASQGIITGSGPSDPAKRKLMENELGWAPYAVKIGDKYIPLQRIIGAMGPSIGTIADIFEAVMAGDEKEAGKSLGASLKNITDQSYLRGLMEFASAVQDPKRYAKSYAMNLGTSMVPFSSLTRSVARAVDKTQRDVKGEGFIDEFSNRLKANIPFLSRELPEKYGVTGNVQERKGTTAERLLSPSPVSTEKSDKIVENVLLNLEYKVPPLERTLKTSLTPDEEKQDYKLEPEEFDVLLKARREATEELRKEIERDGWKRMDSDEQSQTAEEIYRSILNDAKEQVKDMIRDRLGK